MSLIDLPNLSGNGLETNSLIQKNAQIQIAITIYNKKGKLVGTSLIAHFARRYIACPVNHHSKVMRTLHALNLPSSKIPTQKLKKSTTLACMKIPSSKIMRRSTAGSSALNATSG